MYIGMAIDTSGFCLRKYKGNVAGPAACFPVTPGQGHGCSVVVKRIDRFIQFPAAGAVANIAAYFKFVSMRGICGKRNQQERKDRQYDQ
jgi:hypothetical protein